MSRIGRKPIAIPAGVTVTVDGNNVTVTGPKGTLNSTVNPAMNVAIEGDAVVVSRPDDDAKTEACMVLQEHLSLTWLKVLLMALLKSSKFLV